MIIGAGAHGREVAEILQHRAQLGDDVHPLGFVDDDPTLRGRSLDDLPVLGDWSWFEGVDRREVSVICASGFSETRRRMAERATAAGLRFANALSPLAYVSPSARIGQGVVMCQNSIVAAGALIHDHVIINLGAIVSHDTEVGPYATLNPGVNIAGNVSVGEGC